MIRRHHLLNKIVYVNWLLMAFFMLPNATGYPQQAKDKEKLQQTKKQLEQEIRYTNALLEKTQKNKQTSLNKLQILAKQIKSRQALINTINLQLNDVQVEISVENYQIARMSKQLQDLKTEYARMIYNA